MVDVLGDLQQEVRDLMRRIRVLESASPLGWSSVTEGAVEIRSEEGLIVIGSELVVGLLKVIGRLQVLGLGVLEVASLIDLIGMMRVSGDIVVLPGGKIEVGGMVIDPADGGSVAFPGGAIVKAATGGGVQVTQGSYSAVVTGSGASIGRIGRSFTVRDTFPPFQFVGLPTISSGTSGLPVGSMYVSPLGEPYMVVA